MRAAREQRHLDVNARAVQMLWSGRVEDARALVADPTDERMHPLVRAAVRAASDDPAERLNRRATTMMETGAAMKKLAEATDPLYKSLDDSQKRRFAALSRLGGPRGMDGHGPRFRGRDDRDGDGPRHWGPRRTDGGHEGIDRPGEQRL